MAEDELNHIRSGGRRIALYAELGSYYFPDGRLNEVAFRQFIRRSLKERAAGQGSDGEAAQSAERWLSTYLEEILTYLEAKGLGATSFRLFEVAVDEGAGLGISQLSISPGRMKKLLASASSSEVNAPARNLDPDEKRQSIFDAALNVFSERGFHDATMDEIAAASSVGKGTVYRYFKSKEELLDQLLTEGSEEIVARLYAIFSTDNDVLDQIQELVEQLVAFIEDNHVLYRLIQTEGLSPRSGNRTTFDEYLISNFPMLKERFASMNQTRKLKLTSFHTVAYGMLGFIDGVTHRWFRSGMDYPLSDEIPIILEVLFNGFVGQAGASKAFYVAPEDQGGAR